MRLLAVVALAIGLIPSCENDREAANLRVTFSKTASSETRRFVLHCDSFDRPPICGEAHAREALLFPDEGLACPLPASVWVAYVRGTWKGRSVSAEYSPCYDGGSEAVTEWMRLWSFEPPP
jgi:hypothetical protein